MRWLSFRDLLGVTLVFLLMSSCAATGNIELSQPLTADLARVGTVVVEVLSEVEDAEKEKFQMTSLIVSKLRESGLFSKVNASDVQSTEDKGLKLTCTIIELEKVDAATRMMLGAFAGQAHVVADVDVIDLASGTIVGEFKSSGESSGGTIFAGTTEEAVELAATQIVNFISQRKSS